MPGLFRSKSFDSLETLLLDQLSDLYDAEKRLTKALPHMSEAASNPELKNAFNHHLRETEQQVARLEEIFGLLSKAPESETCDAMKGLISEGEEIISAKGHADIKDAALIAAAQRVEHYEIAGYGTARSFASLLGYDRVVDLLQTTLDEEAGADKKLTDLAEGGINRQAKRAGGVA